METTAVQIKNRLYHKLLDDLTSNKIYGEVVFYIQGGNIESCRISDRYTTNELIGIYEGNDSGNGNKRVLHTALLKRKAEN